jgi:serine phosphatase RsbU (regulator of sigma subunit)
MEHAARIFAIRVLLLHVLAFVLLLILTGIGVRNAYQRAQEQAIDQAGMRQQLVAQQTARGIENYFNSVLDNIRLLTSSRLRDLSAPATQTMARPAQQAAAASFLDAVWQQIEPRASHLLAIRTQDGAIVRSQQRPDAIDASQLLAPIQKELASHGAWGVSNRIDIDGFACSLVWILVEDDAPFAVVAVLPLKQLGTQFFDSLTEAKQNIGAALYDNNSVVVHAWDASLIGVNMGQESLAPEFRRMVKLYAARPAGGVERIENVEFVKGQFIERGIVAFEPIKLSPECTWYVSVGSTYADAGGLVNEIFAGTLFWAPILLVVFTGVMVSTAITLIRSRSRLERFRHQMLTNELAQARQIQLSWLPKTRFQGRGLDVFAMNAPASHVSGDFYNYFPLRDGREAVVIGDVTGHGLAAAFLMATTQMLIRSTLTRTGDLVATLNEVNHELCNQAFSGQFVTLLLVVIDQESASIEVINAGHPPPIIVDDGKTELLKTKPQLVLGVEGDTRYYVQRFPLPDLECTILLYTDGIVECRNPRGDRFSMESLRAELEGASELPEELMTRVMQIVDLFRAGEALTDDATAVAMRITSVESTAIPTFAAARV